MTPERAVTDRVGRRSGAERLGQRVDSHPGRRPDPGDRP